MTIIKNKLQANTLLITIIVSLLLTILTSSILLLFYYDRIWESEIKITSRLNQNVYSGINLLFSDTSYNAGSSTDSIDLFGHGEDYVKISSQSWGIYNVGNVKSLWGSRVKSKTFLYGARSEKYYDGAIYLVNHQTDLTLTGNTQLTGNAYLTEKGLRAGFIDQRGYANAKLLNGEVERSLEKMPELKAEGTAYLKALLKTAIGEKKFDDAETLTADTLSQSFENDVLLLRKYGYNKIINKYWKGKIILVCDSVIEVDSSCNFENVVLVAPVIRFDRGFAGCVQAIASDSIVASQNTNFSYPSAFVLLKDQPESELRIINLANNCYFEGVMLALADSADKQKTYLKIGNNSILKGVAYINGYTEIMGKIYGGVLSDYFIYRTGSSVYINNLADVEVNHRLLSKYYLGPQIFGNRKKEIISWLQ